MSNRTGLLRTSLWMSGVPTECLDQLTPDLTAVLGDGLSITWSKGTYCSAPLDEVFDIEVRKNLGPTEWQLLTEKGRPPRLRIPKALLGVAQRWVDEGRARINEAGDFEIVEPA